MHQLSNTNWSLICLNMEVELTFDAVNSCNFARKRQAAPESCSETQSKVNIDGYLQHVFWESFFCFNLLSLSTYFTNYFEVIVVPDFHENAIILHIINSMKMIKSLIQLFLRGDFSFEPKKLIITLTGKSI